jgi:hypothetical protein
VFLITAFLLALFSIYPEYHTYSNNDRVDIDQEFWGPVYIRPPDFQNQSLLITESRLSLVSNVNPTVKVYSDETLLASLDVRSEQSRSVDLNRKTSVLMLNGTSMGIGEMLLSYEVVGYTSPWSTLGIPAAMLAIFGAAFAIRGYTSLRREPSLTD